MMKPKHVATRNLGNVVEELGIDVTDYWINMLKTLPAYEIGVIKASGKLLLPPYIDQLSMELSYFASKGFFLPIVIGGGVQYDAIPGFKDSPKVKGLRCTPKDLLDKIYEVALENQQALVDKLNAQGTAAVAIPVEHIVALPQTKMFVDGNIVDIGFVGEVSSIDTKPIISAILDKKIPVLTHFGMLYDQLYNTNATTVGTELAKYLQAKKFIILGDKPILNNAGEIIPAIYSENEFLSLVNHGVIGGGMVTNGTEAFDLLNYLGPGHSVQLTKLKEYLEGGIGSTGLLEELIGNGSGTKLSVPYIVTSYPLGAFNVSDLNSEIDEILEDYSMRLLYGYFDQIPEDPTIYFASNHVGGAVTYPMEVQGTGFEYLCKIFTHKNYEGLGIATSVIEAVLDDKDVIVWRTSSTNKCNIDKYSRILAHYDETPVVSGDFTVFSIGLQQKDKEKVAAYVSSLPRTLVSR